MSFFFCRNRNLNHYLAEVRKNHFTVCGDSAVGLVSSYLTVRLLFSNFEKLESGARKKMLQLLKGRGRQTTCGEVPTSGLV